MSETTCKSGMTESEKTKLFWASFLALTAAGVGFVFRVMIPNLWANEFNISNEEVGALTGAALWPIAIAMIVFSLAVDKIGYKASMFMAFALQAASVVLTIMASSVDMMWWACFVAGLGHGIVEACINPLCASMYRENKSKMLNILHASWPAGIVLGGVTYILTIGTEAGTTWAQAKPVFWLMLLPVAAYGLMFFLCKHFPVDERVEADVSMIDMLKEFGGLGAGLAITFLFYEIAGKFATGDFKTNLLMYSLIVGVVSGLMFGAVVKSKGKWMFFILCLIMIPLATAEIATDGWIRTLMEPSLGIAGASWAIILSAAIMMVLRFFAGIPLKFMSPPMLLLLSSVFSIIGLFALSEVSGLTMILVAFVFYAVGQTFYWPTVLGFVAEQFPKGGAMTLNTVSAMGLLTVGIFGFPFLGAVQDHFNAKTITEVQPELVAKVKSEKITYKNKDKDETIFTQKTFFGASYASINAKEIKNLIKDEDALAVLNEELKKTGQSSLKAAAILPLIMAVAFILMILYFKSQGGYKPVQLVSDEDENTSKSSESSKDDDTDDDGAISPSNEPLKA